MNTYLQMPHVSIYFIDIFTNKLWILCIICIYIVDMWWEKGRFGGECSDTSVVSTDVHRSRARMTWQNGRRNTLINNGLLGLDMLDQMI